MQHLIEKLEAADEPSRELDAEIAFRCYAKEVGKNGGKYLLPEDNPSWSFGIKFKGRTKDWCVRDKEDSTVFIDEDGEPILMNSLRVPKYSSSIDAAMTLIPDGWYLTKLEKFAGDDVLATLTNRVFNGITVCGASKLDYQFAICVAALWARERK